MDELTMLRLRPLFHVDLAFEVLSALELPNDAASLFRGRKMSWSKELETAYLAAPGRLLLHGLPLVAKDLDDLLGMLRGGRFRELNNSAGLKLSARFADILEAEAPAASKRWDDEAGARLEREKALTARRPELDQVFAALWAEFSDSEPGPEVHDCPSLAHREGTHGRSMLWSGTVHVAVGLSAPIDQVLCQIIHEATHLVTDPPIRKAHANLRQDTRVDSAAFALHQALEQAAVEKGARLVAARAPRLATGYDIWRRRHGC